MYNKYNVGDLVQVEDMEGIWYKIVDVHVYINRSENPNDNHEDVTYGVIDETDGEYLDVDEEEIIATKQGGVSMAGNIKLKSVTKKGKVNELLDMLNSVNAVAKVIGETEELVAEREAIKKALAELTVKG